MNLPEVSVLLVSWNTVGETRRCLASLHDTAGDVTYEVVAVDNGSVDGSAEVLAADPHVRLIQNPRNVGFAAAVNQAYRDARGPLVLLLNSDVELHPGALPTMVAYLRTHPDAAGVSPLYLNPDGTFQQHYVQLPSFAACLALWTVLKRVPGFRGALQRFQMKGEDFSRARELASASCLLVHADVLGADEIFDERFPIYWNDAILTRELEAAGHRMWMVPDAVVTHARGASCRLLGPAMRFRHLLGGLVRYLRITAPRYRVELFRAVLVVDYLLKTACGRTTTLGWGDLLAALRGDVGPLPDGDTRDWVVVAGAATHDGSDDTDARVLLVEPPGSGRARHFTVEQIGPSAWRATLPTMIPIAQRVAPVRWVNQRFAAAQLRQWLDGRAGARTLQVDRAHAYLVGWLGEDVLATFDQVAQRRARSAAIPEVAGGPRPWLIMLSGSPWLAAAHRQQALAGELAAADDGYRVLFVDPPANAPRWHFHIEAVRESVWHASVPSPLPLGRQLALVNRVGRSVTARLLRRWLDQRPGDRLVWIDEDLAHPLAGQLGEVGVVYDATDLDWTFTRRWNRRNLQRSLHSAVAAADLVLASSSALPAYLPAARRTPVVVVANGCDPDLFHPNGPSLPWLDPLPRPRLGYLGAIDTRAFDGELVAAVARAHPEWTFVLVGTATRAGRAPLAGLTNVCIFDAVPFSEAPAVVRGCDVGLIPYRTGALVRYVHPKKCYEYLAAGKPVVATALPAMVAMDAPISVATGAAAFGDAIANALQHAHCPHEVAERREAAIANSWHARGAQVRTLLAGLGTR